MAMFSDRPKDIDLDKVFRFMFPVSSQLEAIVDHLTKQYTVTSRLR